MQLIATEEEKVSVGSRRTGAKVHDFTLNVVVPIKVKRPRGTGLATRPILVCDSKRARRRGTSFEEGPPRQQQLAATTERRGFVVGVVAVGSRGPSGLLGC